MSGGGDHRVGTRHRSRSRRSRSVTSGSHGICASSRRDRAMPGHGIDGCRGCCRRRCSVASATHGAHAWRNHAWHRRSSGRSCSMTSAPCRSHACLHRGGRIGRTGNGSMPRGTVTTSSRVGCHHHGRVVLGSGARCRAAGGGCRRVAAASAATTGERAHS